jgi:hypothetical protein
MISYVSKRKLIRFHVFVLRLNPDVSSRGGTDCHVVSLLSVLRRQFFVVSSSFDRREPECFVSYSSRSLFDPHEYFLLCSFLSSLRLVVLVSHQCLSNDLSPLCQCSSVG